MRCSQIHIWLFCLRTHKNDFQATGRQIEKWDHRARLGIYIGHSPCCAGSITLIMHPRTLYLSPQFHVIIYDDFTTVPAMCSGDIPNNWKDLVDTSNRIFQDTTDDVVFKWATQFTQLEQKCNQPTDPLLDPLIITESVPVNKSDNNDTDYNKLLSINNNSEIILRDNVPGSEGETNSVEGDTPHITPVLTSIHVSEGASHNSASTADVFKGVAPTIPDFEYTSQITPSTDLSILIP